ncbi:MAG: hypothetical protein M1154_04400, partial [Gammaproteobacteria bacterium]|nr:hypothetical protein [Gammaproteobacteria bacterium]
IYPCSSTGLSRRLTLSCPQTDIEEQTRVDNQRFGRYNGRPFSTDGEMSVTHALATVPGQPAG